MLYFFLFFFPLTGSTGEVKNEIPEMIRQFSEENLGLHELMQHYISVNPKKRVAVLTRISEMGFQSADKITLVLEKTRYEDHPEVLAALAKALVQMDQNGLTVADRSIELAKKPVSQANWALDGVVRNMLKSKDATASRQAKTLLALMKYGGDVGRPFAAYELGNLGNTALFTVPDLTLACDDTNFSLVAAAAVALMKLAPSDPKTLPTLTRVLENSHGVDRHAAIEITRRLDPQQRKQFLPAYIRALQDEHYMTRIEAARILKEFGPSAKDAVAGLKQAYTEPPPDYYGNLSNYPLVCKALKEALLAIDSSEAMIFIPNAKGICNPR